jgi:hypothetical protein
LDDSVVVHEIIDSVRINMHGQASGLANLDDLFATARWFCTQHRPEATAASQRLNRNRIRGICSKE